MDTTNATARKTPEIESITTDDCCCGTSVQVRLSDGTSRYWSRKKVHLVRQAGYCESVAQIWDWEEDRDDDLVAKVNELLVEEARDAWRGGSGD
jgi:hypothetical protein